MSSSVLSSNERRVCIVLGKNYFIEILIVTISRTSAKALKGKKRGLFFVSFQIVGFEPEMAWVG